MTSHPLRLLQALAFAAGLMPASCAGGALAAERPGAEHLQTLYFDAARAGRTDLLHGLIKAGMPVDAHDARGYTALILAAYDGHLETVKALLKDGADACATDASGNTALMGVAFKGGLDIAQVLLPHCDVNAVNRQGQSAAMMAALFGRQDIVALLAAHGAKLGLADVKGDTALGLARQQGNTAMVALLESLKPAS